MVRVVPRVRARARSGSRFCFTEGKLFDSTLLNTFPGFCCSIVRLFEVIQPSQFDHKSSSLLHEQLVVVPFLKSQTKADLDCLSCQRISTERSVPTTPSPTPLS